MTPIIEMTTEEEVAAAKRRMARQMGKPSPPAARTDFAILSCHYNFAGFSSLRRNLHRFMAQMETLGIPVYGVELVLEGQSPQSDEYPTWKQAYAGEEAIMWQKEALVNAAAKLVPPSVQYLAEVDADLWFTNPSWAENTIALLQTHNILQPFEYAVWTGIDGETVLHKPSTVKAGKDAVLWSGHPGFATAWRRDYFEKTGGFWPKAVLGGGDHLLWTAYGYGPSYEHSTTISGVGDDPSYKEYIKRVEEVNGGTPPAFTPGIIRHEFHGHSVDRQYRFRAERLKGLVSEKHVAIHDDGYLVWTKKAPKSIKKAVKEYFPARKEDVA